MTLDELRGRLFADVSEVADILGVDERTIRRAIEHEQLPAMQVGARTKIPVPRLLALIEPPTTPADIAPTGISPDAVRGAVELLRAGIGALEALIGTSGITAGITEPSSATPVPIRPGQTAGNADTHGDRTSPSAAGRSPDVP